MTVTIVTKYGEKTFQDKEIINISSKEGFDICANFGFDYMLTVQMDRKTGMCTLLNQFNCQKFLFKGSNVFLFFCPTKR